MRMWGLVIVLLASAAVAEPREHCEAIRKTARFTASFDKVELEKLVQTVSDATCRSFILGEGVKGKISLVGPEKGQLQLTAEQFYAAFLAALDANALATVNEGPFVRIIDKPRARQFPVPLQGDADAQSGGAEVVTRLHHVQYLELEQARAIVAPFLSPGGELVPAPPDVLIVTDVASNQRRLAALLGRLDVLRPSTDTTRVITVRFAAAETLLDKVTRLVTAKPSAPGKPVEQLIALADERTNRLVLAGPGSLVDRAAALVETLDVSVPTDSRARVVKLKSADAKELAGTLEALTSGSSSKRAGPPLPPGTPSSTTTGEVRISVNESLNALLIVSSAGDFRVLEGIIAELDQPVRQVLIETVILEVNLTKDLHVGLSMHGGAKAGDGPFVIGSQPEGSVSSALPLTSLATVTGLALGIQGAAIPGLTSLVGSAIPSFGVTLQASQTDSDVNVISTPHILTSDNKEAEITVGQRIPFQLGVNPSVLAAAASASSVNSALQLGSVSREKVELKLTVKPHIGAGDDIRLEINQQAEELAGKSSAAGPITSSRGQKTTVIARNEETLVLGGIMQDREIETVNKVPLLGDVPLIGQLFRHTERTKTKVNLLVFLTPHIIESSDDVRRLMDRKTEERRRMVEALYGTRDALPVTIDFARKLGPLAALGRRVERTEHPPGDRHVDPAVN